MMNPSAGGVSAAAVEPAKESGTPNLAVEGNGYRGGLHAAGRMRYFLRNREIYSEGDDADCVFKVESGVVRTYNLLRDGRRQINAFHGQGGVFGLESGKLYGLSAAAASDCAVISHSRRNLEACRGHSPIWSTGPSSSSAGARQVRLMDISGLRDLCD